MCYAAFSWNQRRGYGDYSEGGIRGSPKVWFSAKWEHALTDGRYDSHIVTVEIPAETAEEWRDIYDAPSGPEYAKGDYWIPVDVVNRYRPFTFEAADEGR